MPEEIRADLLLGRDTLSPGLVKAGRAASDASSNVRQLTRDLYEAGKIRATPIVDLQDAAATAKLTGIAQKLRDLGARVASPEVSLDDKAARASVAAMRVRLDALGRKVASPRVTLEGLARAEAQILALDLSLDRLGKKTAKPDVSLLSRLGGLFGGSGGPSLFSRDLGGLAGLGGGGGGAGAAGLGPLGIGAAIAGALALAPAAIPLGLGGLFGGGGALLAGRLGATGIQKLQADRQALAQALVSVRSATAPGTASASQLLTLHQAQQRLAAATTPAQRAAAQASIARAQASIAGTTAPGTASASQLLALRQARQQLSQDQAKFGGFVPFGHAVNRLQQTGLHTLLGALTGTSPGFSAGPHGQPGGSFLSGLIPIFKQLGHFTKSLGPQLGDLFRASLPFVSAFVKVMEQFARAVLPAVTQSLKLMAPDLPIIVQGFKLLAQGIAGFLVNLGPGMKDSAIIFKASMEVVKGVLQLAGAAASAFAIGVVKTAEGIRAFARGVPPFFDKMFHGIASLFDAWRHDWAAIWDQVFSNTIGRVQRGVHDIAAQFDKWRHNTAAIFDGVRHDIASAWTVIWNNTDSAVRTGIGTVVSFFRKLPGEALAALSGLGHSLYAFGHAALSELWAGLKSVGGSILSWLKNFIGGIPGAIMHFLGMSPPHPGSVFFDLGANFMRHLEAGIQSRARHALNAAKAAVPGGRGGPVSASAAQAQAYARSRLAAFGWSASQMGPLIALWNQESGWNRLARNPSSGAYGIPQALPPGKMGAAANPPTSSAAAQINWGLGYIKGRYGSPAGAEAHERAFNWYGSGLLGGIFSRPTLIGVGERGPERVDVTPVRPQMVMPNRGGGQQTIVLEIAAGGEGALTAALLQVLRKQIRVRGGGNVQAALGRL